MEDDFLLESEMGDSVSSSGCSVTISVANGDCYKRQFSEHLLTLREEIEDLETSKSSKQYSGIDNSSLYNSRRPNNKQKWMQRIDEEINDPG